MKRLIIVDLDETLLTTDKRITEENKQVIKTLRDKGHIVVIATGRAYHGAITYYNELELDTLLITDNGALISNDKDPNFKKQRTTIPNEIFIEMFKKLKHTVATGAINKDSISYGFNYNAHFDNSFNGIPPKKSVEADYLNLGFEPMNLDVAVFRDHQDYFESYFKNHPVLDARYWSGDKDYGYYDIHLRSVNKALAAKFAMDYYNIKSEHTFTFGDGVNDTELLSLTENGTAMLNANDTVKKYASKVTKHDNNNSGVGKALIEYFNLV